MVDVGLALLLPPEAELLLSFDATRFFSGSAIDNEASGAEFLMDDTGDLEYPGEAKAKSDASEVRCRVR